MKKNLFFLFFLFFLTTNSRGQEITATADSLTTSRGQEITATADSATSRGQITATADSLFDVYPDTVRINQGDIIFLSLDEKKELKRLHKATASYLKIVVPIIMIVIGAKYLPHIYE